MFPAGVRLNAGEQNYGIYVRLPDRNNEEWRITHPVGNITGFLRGNLYTTISDTSYVTSLGPEGKREKGQTALRAIINYPDEVRNSAAALTGPSCMLTARAVLAELDQRRQIRCGRRRV